MPRTPEFDKNEALSNAMLLFWQKGYNDTSIDDLVQFTGVSRYGLYGSFGNKHDLFLACLDNYRDTTVGKQLERLSSNDAGWAEIQAFFDSLVALAATPEGALGCLMCNTSSEVAPHDETIALKVEAHLKRMQQAFIAALRTAQATKELPDTLSLLPTADFLVGVAQGLFVLSRSAKNITMIRHIRSVALASIKP